MAMDAEGVIPYTGSRICALRPEMMRHTALDLSGAPMTAAAGPSTRQAAPARWVNNDRGAVGDDKDDAQGADRTAA
jgi:hypothetical protein